ncbi:MAG: PilN domain-containing protein, partial [Dehalococcoidales bacterium]|nr:PilN domain-containing protein [Dehalococcoidales bacterium]
LVVVGFLAYAALFVRDAGARTEELRAQLTSTQGTIAQTRKEIADLKVQAESIRTQIQPALTLADSFDSTITRLNYERADVDGDLNQIVKLAQANVVLTRMNHTGNTVTVSGTAPDETNILTYAKNLRSSGQFKGVIVTSITREEAEEEQSKPLDFELRLVN